MRLAYVFNALGLILRCISLVILLPVLVALYYHDYFSVMPFLSASFVSLFLSFVIRKKSDTFESLNDIKKTEALMIVTSAWVLFSLIAAIPYVFYGFSFLDSLFEAVSGITTTGTTILTKFDYPKTMFFWRSMSQWLGGMGIIVLFIAILPQFAVAGRQMFFAETPGPTEDKITPRIKHTAIAMWTIYVLLTVIEIILLKISGMPLFDCVCNSFSTVSGGGFSPNAQSIAGYHSIVIKWIITFFMFFAAMNFSLIYKVWYNKKFSLLLKDDEFKFYTGIVVSFTFFIALCLYFSNGYTVVDSITDSCFQVLSIICTSGAASVDFAKWTLDAKLFLFLLMFVGGCAGSASGGLKMVRLLFIFKYLRVQIARILHPNAVYPIKINGVVLPIEVIAQMLAFSIFYYALFALTAFLISLIESNALIGVTGSIATIGNIGPGFGSVIGPMGSFASLHPASKVIGIINMLVGRLELIPFLAMLHPDFWRLKN